MKVALILGTRPQIIKSSSLIHSASRDPGIELDVIHTGQHYDYEMTKVFFEELSLPDPVVNLDVGSGSHAQQIGEIMIRLEPVLLHNYPDLVVVPGDTNSTLAGSLTAVKLQLPVAHIEAGARSFDRRMPEEINRVLTDHSSTLLFSVSVNCTSNLLDEGIPGKNIFTHGDTMYDVLRQQLPKAQKTTILEDLELEPNEYAVITTHRPENVDLPHNLRNIVDAVTQLKPLKIVFPVHPRTHKQLINFDLYSLLRKHDHIRLVDPVGYHESLKLIENARLVLTDSGGIQKECLWVKTPCITLRENTEWIETVQLEANYLTGANTRSIVQRANDVLRDELHIARALPNPFGDGTATRSILNTIKDM